MGPGERARGQAQAELEPPPELFVATGNEHKLLELGRLFPGILLRTPAQAGIRFEF